MPIISAQQFIERANHRPPLHHVFKTGMHVFLVKPVSAAGPTEFDFSPRTNRTSGAVKHVVDQVRSSFTVEPELKPAGSGHAAAPCWLPVIERR